MNDESRIYSDINQEIRELLAEIDDLDDARAALGEKRAAAITALRDVARLNKKALAAFLVRRKLSTEDKQSWNESIESLCKATGSYLQPDMFRKAEFGFDAHGDNAPQTVN